MILDGPKDWAKRHWPALRLRTILLAVLMLVAALPVFSAVFLRVYENTLVRQSEAEMAAQGAALTAAASVLWPQPPGLPAPSPEKDDPDYYRPEAVSIDLSSTPVLPERPPAGNATTPVDPDAEKAAVQLEPIIHRTGQVTLAAIALLDRHGRVVSGYEQGGSYADLPEVQAALEGTNRTVLRRDANYRPRYSFEWLSRASALRIHHARPILVDGKVVGVLLLSRSPRALFRGIYEDRGKIAVGMGLVLGLLIVLAGLVSRGITRPIEALSAASRDVAAGDGAIPDTPATAAIEIRALYEDFRAMAEAIARRSRYLRDFAAAVSHEFKTPLAGISGAAELLEDHYATMSEEERKRFLANITADTARLSQLVTRLLDLARADMARPEAGTAAPVAAPVLRVADAMRGEALAVTIDLPSRLPDVAAPEAALETVLTTLLENSRQAGATLVAIRARVTDQTVVLTLTDNGPGIAPADRENLFEPFFTTRRAEGGTGLGLPIARSLLAASHGTVEIIHSTTGAAFQITLPLARII